MSHSQPNRKAEQEQAISAITNILERISREEREPDPWEKVFLANSIFAAFSGQYTLSITDAKLALTSHAARGVIEEDYSHCTLAVLTKALNALKSEPFREFPYF